MTGPIQTGLFPITGKTIGFARKEFKTGQNFTVRLGDQWIKDRGIILNDYVGIVDPDRQEIYFQARITHLMTCSLAEIPSSIIKANHQTDMRDGIGLVLGLQEYYKKTLVGTDRVSCIGFEPIKLEIKPKVTVHIQGDAGIPRPSAIVPGDYVN